jgi:secreted trypsin-like serine protease
MHDMTADKGIRDPLWAILVGALVAAIGISFFVFVQSGEAAPQEMADEQPSYASVTPRIVGGTEVPNGKYPFMSYIELYRNGKPIGSCTGSLIDPDSVLTAAHCLIYRGVLVPTGALLTVGATDRTQKNQGQVIEASEPFIHPRYNHPTPNTPPNKKNVSHFAYDAAVLKLKRPVKGIKPIKLATAKQDHLERPGRKLTTAGWGTTRTKGKQTPTRMREVSHPVVSDSSAKRAYDSFPPAWQYFPSLAVAAGEKGKGACHGDSGGPLFDSGSRTQVGITSHGPREGTCATARYPAVFTEVNNPQIRRFILAAAKR